MRQWPLTAAKLGVVAVLLFLWGLASVLPHNLDEVHGFNSYVRESVSWTTILTTFPEPGHHVVHNVLLRLLYPLLDGSAVALRWIQVVCAALCCWLLYRYGHQPSLTGRDDSSVRWSRVPLVLVPMSLSFFVFYGVQSRGYMIGATLFLGFFILSQRLHRQVRWGLDPMAGVGMGLLGALSIGSVLSNGTFVVGACVGFGLLDLMAGRWRVFAARVGFMLTGALFLVSWHPAIRHLDKLAEFNEIFGRKLQPNEPLGQIALLFGRDLFAPTLWLCVLAALGVLLSLLRKEKLWLPVICVVVTSLTAILWTENYQFPRSYMTATVLAALMIQGLFDGVLTGVEKVGKRGLVPLTSGLLMALVLTGWGVSAQTVHAQFAEWGVSIDTHEWYERAPVGSVSLLPWDLYQAYYYDYPVVESQIEQAYSNKTMTHLQLVGFEGIGPMISGSASAPAIDLSLIGPGEVIGTTGRQRWTLSDVQYLGEWGADPVSVEERSCERCFVLLLTRGERWFYPQFGETPVSGVYFSRPYSREEMSDSMIAGHVLPAFADLPAAVKALQADRDYKGPVRAFLVRY